MRFIHPDLAAAAFSLIPGEALLGSPLRSDQVIADILGIPERMVPTIEWAYPILNGVAETEVRFDTLGIEASAIGWLDPEGRPFVSYALRAPGPGVNLGEHEGAHYMTFSVASYQIGRASCRARVEISVVAVPLKKKHPPPPPHSSKPHA